MSSITEMKILLHKQDAKLLSISAQNKAMADTLGKMMATLSSQADHPQINSARAPIEAEPGESPTTKPTPEEVIRTTIETLRLQESSTSSPRTSTPPPILEENKNSTNWTVFLTNSVLGGAWGRGLGYDGADTIYNWGFVYDPVRKSNYILKYSIFDDTMSRVNSPALHSPQDGIGILVDNQNLFHFGGDQRGSIVRFQFNATQSVWRKVGRIPRIQSVSASVWDGGEYIYVTGGVGAGSEVKDSIWRFSTVTSKVEIVAHLPIARRHMTAVWEKTTRSVYIFGGKDYPIYFSEILKFDPADGSVRALDVKLPAPSAYSCAVTVGEVVYVIGGYARRGRGFQMIRFNPATEEINTIPLNNFPNGIYGHNCVFVEKLRRIYIFGGFIKGGDKNDQVMYIPI